MREPNGDDVRSAAAESARFLETLAERDWSTAVAEMDGTVATLVAHMALCNLWYAFDLAARDRRTASVFQPSVDDAMTNDALIGTLYGAAELCASVCDAAPLDARGYHPAGWADRGGFAAMACDEIIVHTWDIARTLDADFSPNDDLALITVDRLFPWTVDYDASPFDRLLWSNGRVELREHARQTGDWSWHCAPLIEYSGGIPRFPE